MFTFCTKMTYTKPQTWKTPPKDPKVAQECPRSDFNAPKVTSESPQSGSRCSQNEPKCSQVVPQGLSRPPKIDQKRSPRPSRDTFKKTNVSTLREPHYLLCFWRVTLREPHYLLCFKHIENPNFPQKWWKPYYLLCFRATEKTCLSKGTGSAFIF